VGEEEVGAEVCRPAITPPPTMVISLAADLYIGCFVLKHFFFLPTYRWCYGLSTLGGLGGKAPLKGCYAPKKVRIARAGRHDQSWLI